MPKVNFVSFDRTDDGPAAYKRNLALASALMKPEAPGSTPIAAGANILSQALGGWLARDADVREREAQAEALNPLNDLVDSQLSGGAGGSSVGAAGGRRVAEAPGDPNSRDEAGVTARAKEAMAHFEGKGYSKQAAAGIVGRLTAESGTGLRPDAVGDNGTAFGVAQWRGPRFKNLQKFAAERGTDWRDRRTQYDFLDAELQGYGGDRGAMMAFQGLRKARNPMEAAAAFMHFERPAGYTPQNPAGGHGYGRTVQMANALAGGWADGDGAADAPEAGAQTAQFQPPGQPGSIPAGGSGYDVNSSPVIARAQRSLAVGRQMMRNPRTAEAGLSMVQDAMKAIDSETARLQGQDFQRGQQANQQEFTRGENMRKERREGPPRVRLKIGGQEVEAQYDERTGAYVPLQTKGFDGMQAPYNPEGEMSLRKEIAQLPSYQKFYDVADKYNGMRDAASQNDKVGDMAMVYNLASIMDPGSVVREGEQLIVRRSAYLTEEIKGAISALNGSGGALTPDTRQRLMKTAKDQVSAYKRGMDRDLKRYERISGRSGFDWERIRPEAEEPEAWMAPAAPGSASAPAPPTGQPYRDRHGSQIIIMPGGSQ